MTLALATLVDLGNTAGLTKSQVTAVLTDNPSSTNMTRCFRCSSSSGCTDCKDCTNATNCVSCEDCTNATNCYMCKYLTYAYNCKNCTGQSSQVSSYLYDCSNCTDCDHCIQCTNARSLSYSIAGIDMSTNQTQWLAIWNALTSG